MPPLYFRTEASPDIGMGHFMRCFALAEAARNHGQPVVFLLNQTTPAIVARLEAIGARHECLTTAIGSLEDISEIQRFTGPDALLILDSYKINGLYLEALYGMSKLILIDDLCALDPLPCHVVINAAIAARDMPYARLAPEARRLIGPDYAAVRKEFREVAKVSGDHMAIMFGGSDAKGLSLKTAQTILQTLDAIEVHVIAGHGLRDLAALVALAASEPRLKVISSPESVAEALKDARIVITAAGTSVAEIATMGLMALVLVIADNQMAHMQTCPYPVRDARSGLPEDMGAWVQGFYNDLSACETIAREAMGLFDGQGCARILREINQLSVTT